MKHLLAYLAICSALFSPSIAQSSALTKPFNGYINKAVSNTIVKKLQTMGFAANDPIYGITLAAAETTLAAATIGGSVAATVGAIGSAPVWLSVALGLGAVYEIYDYSMGSSDWKATPGSNLVNITTGTVTVAAPPPPTLPPLAWQSPVAPGTPMPVDYSDPGIGVSYKYPSDLKLCASVTGLVQGTFCGADVQAIRNQAFTKFIDRVSKNNVSSSITTEYYRANAGYCCNQSVQFDWDTGAFIGGGPHTYTRTVSITSFDLITSSGPTKGNCSFSAFSCPEGVLYTFTETYRQITASTPSSQRYELSTTATTNQSFTYSVFNNPSFIDPAKTYTLNDAAAKLNSADLTTRADPELLAAIANKIWQQAAQQPGYAGAPYDAANPVTAADVLADIAAGLYPHPTVADLLSLVSPNAQTAPQLDPAAQPVQATEGTAKVDLGPDPGIGQPALETTPTGSAIVAQVMGLLPSLSGFTMPAHTSTCTAPTFSFFGSTQTMQPMCDLLEQQRLLLSTIFSAMWGIASLAMVLRA